VETNAAQGGAVRFELAVVEQEPRRAEAALAEGNRGNQRESCLPQMPEEEVRRGRKPREAALGKNICLLSTRGGEHRAYGPSEGLRGQRTSYDEAVLSVQKCCPLHVDLSAGTQDPDAQSVLLSLEVLLGRRPSGPEVGTGVGRRSRADACVDLPPLGRDNDGIRVYQYQLVDHEPKFVRKLEEADGGAVGGGLDAVYPFSNGSDKTADVGLGGQLGANVRLYFGKIVPKMQVGSKGRKTGLSLSCGC